MKQGIFAIMMLLLFCSIFGETFTIDLPTIHIERSSDHAQINAHDSTLKSFEPGAPDIPIVTHFFELPGGMRIDHIEVVTEDVQLIDLDQELAPVQEAAPLSHPERTRQIATIQPNKIPTSYLKNSGSGFSGTHRIGWVALERCLYNADEQTLEVPGRIRLNIQYTGDQTQPATRDNETSALVASILLNRPSRNRTMPGYLIITAEEYETTIWHMAHWRLQCGYDYTIQTVEWIDENIAGDDLQEKIRNYIIQMVNEQGISYVTLAGDADVIPVRYFFAFDCAYGIYDDENEIPADMYYSCLDGDWDANENGIYGEDDDNPDYLPDVFLSRLSFNSIEQCQSYIARLLEYDQGELHTYESAAGVSMELWEGSNSEVAQQYIYDRYFPDDFIINLLYGDENTQENAFALIDEDPNIFQHTGHASTSVLSLEEGSLRYSDMQNMTNTNAGLFYSIGCWSAAMDYPSIGERIVTPNSGGFLAYVGNSRYGWGAPAAPGFGFSEFFQKEFFRVLFEEDSMVSHANVMQKLPFIPMYQGTSVYKWCAYQLNMIGDSGFRLFTQEPIHMSYHAQTSQGELIVDVWTENESGSGKLPVANAWVAITQEYRAQTDETGRARIEVGEGLTGSLTISKPGFKTIVVTGFDTGDLIQPYVADFVWNDGDPVVLGESFDCEVTLANPTSEDVTMQYSLDGENDHFFLDEDEGSVVLPANGTESFTITGTIADQTDNPEDTSLHIKIFLQQTGRPSFTYYLMTEFARPKITMAMQPEQVSQYQYELNFQVHNEGDLDTEGLTVSALVEAGNGTLSGLPIELDDPFPVGGSIDFNTTLTLDENDPDPTGALLLLTFQTRHGSSTYSASYYAQTAIGDVGIEENFEGNLTWEGDDAWQTVDTYAYGGLQSLSCRPEEPGFYEIATPWTAFMYDGDIRIQYKYKMPMYGNDGVFFILETEETSDTLLFLGAGGALADRGRPAPEVYIEGDWAEYCIDPSDYLVDSPPFSTHYRIKLEFLFHERLDGFNEYDSMSDIGVFIDDYSYTPPVIDYDIQENDEVPIGLSIYPNPVRGAGNLTIAFSIAKDRQADVGIFNIRGQKVRGFKPTDSRAITWDMRDARGKPAASGVYFARVKSAGKQTTRKFLLIR